MLLQVGLGVLHAVMGTQFRIFTFVQGDTASKSLSGALSEKQGFDQIAKQDAGVKPDFIGFYRKKLGNDTPWRTTNSKLRFWGVLIYLFISRLGDLIQLVHAVQHITCSSYMLTGLHRFGFAILVFNREGYQGELSNNYWKPPFRLEDSQDDDSLWETRTSKHINSKIMTQ